MHLAHRKSRGLAIAVMVGSILIGPAVAYADDAPRQPAIEKVSAARGMWIWRMQPVLSSQAEQERLLQASSQAGITDLYVFLTAQDFQSEAGRISEFVQHMHDRNISVWGLDGCRCYFADAEGPSRLYEAVDAMVGYNDHAAPRARFVGFQNISEPHDIDHYPHSFHNERTNSQLKTDGKGIWQATAALDREKLLEDWIEMQRGIAARLKPSGLKTAAAVLSSTENYYGEPLTVSYDGRTDSVGHLMMPYVDDYIVLTFNTDPANAAGRVSAQAAYASVLPADVRPRVFGAIEIEAGNGSTISYGDTPGKRSRAVVVQDIGKIEAILKSDSAFAGVSIHSWEGWSALGD